MTTVPVTNNLYPTEVMRFMYKGPETEPQLCWMPCATVGFSLLDGRWGAMFACWRGGMVFEVGSMTGQLL